MPRDLTSPMLAAIGSNALRPCVMLDLTLNSGVEYVWSGIGLIDYGGHTYKGVGSLGDVGELKEGTEVRAEGTTVALSGIDATLLNDCMNDIKLGSPAAIWIGLFDDTTATITTRMPFYQGTVDKPMVALGPDSIAISLALENKMSNHQRATNRRYTSADQRYYHPNDTGFFNVERQSDIALIWG